MSIRVRHVDGVLVALCAAETEPAEGDLYLDDAVHSALYEKFDRDREQEAAVAPIEPRWIRFVEVPVPDRKTRCWRVVAKQGNSLLGTVEWYTGWRRYTFAAASFACVFEEQCLRDIAVFVEARTREHREAARARKAVAS